MAADTPDLDLDPQDTLAEAFDETHFNDEADFATLEDLPDVVDVTQALGDARDSDALDADELDPEALDDEDLETDEDVDDMIDDSLEDSAEDTDIGQDELDAEDGVEMAPWDDAEVQAVADVDQVTDPDDEEADEYESEELSDEDLQELGYKDEQGRLR